MADNVTANPGAGGAVFASDDIGGVQYPRAKVVWGADGSVNDTSAASPMPVAQTGALPAGNNNIGDVDIASLPALPTGGNTIGTVDLSAGSLAALETITVASITAAIPAGNNNIGDVDIASFTAGAIVEVQGDVAHDAAVGGNPVLNGYEARTTTDITAVAQGDAVRGQADSVGKQVVLLGSTHDRHVDGKGTFSNTTAADIIAAAGAGLRIAVTHVLVVNGHATVSTKVEVRRGTTVIIQGYAAAAGGGFSQNAGGAPLFITAANEAVSARNVTTGADVDVFVSGYVIGN